ncbi:hypothetical protein QSJ18_08515 [Gordonia sp. ABSL1-1]|uniref:Rv3212 family protein n=1 Tax=Gordonia sp. ABSL1-1 TaxID=3053923 RepID=UPI00257236EB|nr:hypothetical protein [Gordonia sp. ABSL1-1]MDL9936780.1 hypothetical protein [Gordonia sp. ABSL1-1]
MPRVAPERRTRLDLTITAIIVVLVVAVGVLAWYVSPVRHTDSAQAAHTPPSVDPVRTIPAAFRAAWHAHSPATTVPAVGDAVVVTGDGGTVIGRDPRTGREIWSYRRDLALCATATAWPGSVDSVLAVYRNSRGCSEVTALDAKTGRRTAARSSDADPTLRLITDSGYIVAQGPTRLETWGSNLVRGIEYGRVDAPVNPDTQPGRADCTLFSSAVSGDRVAVVERCGNEPGFRLTVLGAVLDAEEHVTQYGSSIITNGAVGAAPVIIGMSSEAITVYDGGVNTVTRSAPTIRRFNTDGAPLTANGTTVDGLPTPPPSSFPLRSETVVSYWTGVSTVVLDADTGVARYQVPGALGPGAIMAGQLLLPSPSGISVRDPMTGRELRTIPLTRSGPVSGPISLRVIGDMVVETRGGDVETFVPA